MRYQAKTDVNVRPGPGVEYGDPLHTFNQGDEVEELDTSGWVPILMEDDSVGWVSRNSLKYADETAAPWPAPRPPAADPIWIRWARSKLGQKEVPGPGDNPEIQSWYHLTTLPRSMWRDATAWCAVFVNAAFMLNNIKTIRSAGAEEWKKFGTATDSPQVGDVVVFQWADGSHHVAFFLGFTPDGRVQVIGGNQGDAVTITTYPAANVMTKGYRRPPV